MPSIETSVPLYEKPRLLQVFKRVQNEFTTEYGFVSGLKENGETWTATIHSGVAHDFRFYNSTPVGEWVPVPADEVAVLPAALASLGDAVDKATLLGLADRVAVLVADAATERDEYLRLQARVDALANPAPVEAAPAPPRASRVAAPPPSLRAG
jgi:hypothetical protein